jgi:hypothetical protein
MKKNHIENENDRNEWLESKGFNHNEFPFGKIKPEWESFPIIKEYRNYQKSLKLLKSKKNHIEKVWIERQIDESPDTSFLGEYTDKKDDWVICCHCGEFVAIAEKNQARHDELEDEIYLLHNTEKNEEEEKQLAVYRAELEALDLHECPNSRREYNYFKPYAGCEEEGSENYQKYGKQDFLRMEGLNSGSWYFMGIIAKAEIVTENDTIQVIRSGGLWGVESNSGDYLEQVGKDELNNLRLELESLGFGKRAIDRAFQNVETKDK